MRVRDHAEGKPASVASRVLAIAGGGLSLWTAWLGGKLVEEMGEAVKPAMEHMSRHEHGSDHGRDRLDPGSPLGKPEEAGRAG
jgi:hypothetical protein